MNNAQTLIINDIALPIVDQISNGNGETIYLLFDNTKDENHQ
jgi:hypothetical protein